MSRTFLYLAALMCLATASPANAGPLAALVPIVIGVVVKSAVAKLVLTLVATVALSALQRAKQKKAPTGGTVIESTRAGGTNSRSIIVGTYCTAGSLVCPPMSHGQDGDTPNAYLTHVVAIADYPVDGLEALIVNGEYVTYGGVASEYGFPLGGKYAGKGWIKFYDGRQTTADPYLVSRYGSYVRPWTSNHIGHGTSYAILTWKYDQELFKGEPTFKFVVRGARLYDPRLDSSVGGTGSQRWADPSTWTFTANNAVICYNILRGITLYDGAKWGGECTADDLPLATWVAAMNKCDVSIPLEGGGTEPQYRCGYEVLVAEMEPADVVEELIKSCSGAITEVGGIYKMRAGGPALPTVFVTDNDFLVSQPKDYDPFPALNATNNGIFATFPHPGEEWNPHDAPALVVPEYVVQDDNRENFASVTLPAVPYPIQVQRLMRAWLEDDRRWRRHGASLGPYSFILEPMDTIAWTSAHNGYIDKAFELSSTTTALMTLVTDTDMREVEPDDYDWDAAYQLPDPTTPGNWNLPAAQAVPGWGVEAYSILDASGDPRRPAIRAFWNPNGAEDATALKIQVRVAVTETAVCDITVSRVQDGQTIIAEGIMPNQTLQVRARYQAERPTQWTSWLSVTTSNIKLGPDDVDAADAITLEVTRKAIQVFAYANGGVASWADANGNLRVFQGATDVTASAVLSATPGPGVTAQINTANNTPIAGQPKGYYLVTAMTGDTGQVTLTATISGITLTEIVSISKAKGGYEIVANTLPTTDLFAGRIVFRESDGKLYRYVTGTGWTAAVNGADIDNATLTTAKFANGIEPVTNVTSVPSTKSTNTIFNTTDGKLYRWNGSAYVATIPTGDLTGTITETQIANNAISTPKLAANAVTAAKLAADSVEAGKIAAGAVNTRELAAKAATIEKLAIGTASNMIPNSNFETLAGWSHYGGAGYQVTPYSGTEGVGIRIKKGAGTSEAGLRMNGFATGAAGAANYVPVTPGEKYRVKCKVTRKGGVDLGLVGIAADLLLKNGSRTSVFINGHATNPPVGITVNVSGEYEIPSDAVGILFQISYWDHAASANGDVVVTEMSFTRMAGGELIVDGAILADKIAANAVTTDKINAGAITAAKINVTQLSAISANMGTLTAGKIQSVGGGTVIDLADDTATFTASKFTITSPGGGARTEYSGGNWRVYDASNNLRVRMGVW